MFFPHHPEEQAGGKIRERDDEAPASEADLPCLVRFDALVTLEDGFDVFLHGLFHGEKYNTGFSTFSGVEWDMKKRRFVSTKKQQPSARSLPVIIERDENGMYVVECPLLSGCYSQGRTLDEALCNIQEVIALV